MNTKMTPTWCTGLALALALASSTTTGCGAGLDVSSEQAALTETQSEASDTVSAAAELGDEELAPETSSDFDMQRRGRPEIGAALRALVWGVRVCGDRITIERQLATASCDQIGRSGEYLAGVTVTFDQCALPSGGMIDGVITASTTKQLVAGQPCAPGALIDVDRSISIDALTHRRASGVTVEWKNVNGTSHATRPIATRPALLALQLQGERSATGLGGRALFHHLFQGAASVGFSPGDATTAPSRTVSGQLTIQHLLAQFTATITATDVTKAADCCRPTGGSVTMVRSGSREATHTVEFGPACGAIALDGEALDLPECG